MPTQPRPLAGCNRIPTAGAGKRLSCFPTTLQHTSVYRFEDTATLGLRDQPKKISPSAYPFADAICTMPLSTKRKSKIASTHRKASAAPLSTGEFVHRHVVKRAIVGAPVILGCVPGSCGYGSWGLASWRASSAVEHRLCCFSHLRYPAKYGDIGYVLRPCLSEKQQWQASRCDRYRPPPYEKPMMCICIFSRGSCWRR